MKIVRVRWRKGRARWARCRNRRKNRLSDRRRSRWKNNRSNRKRRYVGCMWRCEKSPVSYRSRLRKGRTRKARWSDR